MSKKIKKTQNKACSHQNGTRKNIQNKSFRIFNNIVLNYTGLGVGIRYWFYDKWYALLYFLSVFFFQWRLRYVVWQWLKNRRKIYTYDLLFANFKLFKHSRIHVGFCSSKYLSFYTEMSEAKIILKFFEISFPSGIFVFATNKINSMSNNNSQMFYVPFDSSSSILFYCFSSFVCFFVLFLLKFGRSTVSKRR